MTRMQPQFQSQRYTQDEDFPVTSDTTSLFHQFESLSTLNPSSAASTATGSTEKVFEKFDPAAYTKPFLTFLQDCPTVFHTVQGIAKDYEANGFIKLSEQDAWELKAGGKYYVTRNGSSIIAFVVGKDYVPGNGAAMIAGHIDALTVRLKPVSKLRSKAGYEQLAVAPYAGALNSTWWDRDLGIGGRVLVKEGGKIVTKLVHVPHPIARIPTLAPHFGAVANGPFNPETNMVPIIGLDDSTSSSGDDFQIGTNLGAAGSFASTQPPRLVRIISKELSITDYSSIVNWELELFDTQASQTGGLEHEFLFGGRLDDKLCSWAAAQALINSTKSSSVISKMSSQSSAAADKSLKIVALFDDEEIGSLLRQGARGNFLPDTVKRINASIERPANLAKKELEALNAQTFANSFLISSDVTHAVNPNFLNVYLENHSPRLNVGVTIAADSNGHMTTDAVSAAFLQSVAQKSDCALQVFQIRNDSRSGGTVGPMLSSAMGCRAIDAGIAQLSMHSIRATTGSLDVGLGVKLFQGFYESFEDVNAEFKE